MSYRPTIFMGRIAGVEIRLDLLVVVLIGVLFLSSLKDASARNAAPGEVWAAVAQLVLLVAMMACMLGHELGHALMARMRGHRPTMILLSFVGLTFFDTKKARASDEFLIAIAGPMVNLAIAILLSPFIYLALAADNARGLAWPDVTTWQGFLAWLSILNFGMAALNLTPGWPTDGARAVRAWLSRKHGYGVGTRRAVAISHGLWLTVAGISIILMAVLPRVQAMTKSGPVGNPSSLPAMYQVVVLLLAAVGIYYGWAENRRVRRLGEQQAAEVVGPPPEFRPGKRQDQSRVIDAEVSAPGSGKPLNDMVNERASRAAAAGTVMWKAAKATGKGTGWFLRKGARLVGGMLADDKKPDAEQK